MSAADYAEAAEREAHERAQMALIAEQSKRLTELEALLGDVLHVWEPTREDYQSAPKGDRQFARARAVWEAAHAALDGKK